MDVIDRILTKDFNPNQPRIPKGKPGGGRFFSFASFKGEPIAEFADHVGKPWYGVDDWADVKVDLPAHFERSDAYMSLPEWDDDAKPAYDAFVRELGAQYDLLTKKLGISVQVVDEDPYPGPEELLADIRDNKRIKVLATKSTPPGHPYMTDEENDRFRAVHDAFGHAGTGRGFDRHGEEAAYQAHANMFSDLARFALATETRGQNAVLIKTGDFPPQKFALLPEQYTKALPMPDDEDTSNDNGTVTHATGGRWPTDMTPAEQAAWRARRAAARSEQKDFQFLDAILDEEKGWREALHPRGWGGRFTSSHERSGFLETRSGELRNDYHKRINSDKAELLYRRPEDKLYAEEAAAMGVAKYQEEFPWISLGRKDDSGSVASANLTAGLSWARTFENPEARFLAMDVMSGGTWEEDIDTEAKAIKRMWRYLYSYSGRNIYPDYEARFPPDGPSQREQRQNELADVLGADWRERRSAGTKDFNPNQPRIPAGSPGGGRWGVVEAILGGGGSSPKTDRFHGRGVDALFPHGNLTTTTPWPTMSRRRDVQDYDPDLVRETLIKPPVTQLIDPRGLRSTQPKITRGGVDYYANSPDYAQRGETFADKGNVGNKLPFIYRREDGQDIILTGHHRAAAALVKAEPLRAIVVSGPWGPPRKGQR